MIKCIQSQIIGKILRFAHSLLVTWLGMIIKKIVKDIIILI
jgi:hypothetical protein